MPLLIIEFMCNFIFFIDLSPLIPFWTKPINFAHIWVPPQVSQYFNTYETSMKLGHLHVSFVKVQIPYTHWVKQINKTLTPKQLHAQNGKTKPQRWPTSLTKSTLIYVLYSFCFSAAFVGFETSNKYVVKNTLGQQVYFAAEGIFV